MLAGRKLLLADDSITIQKVVALTFADEGIEVLAVNNGADAIEQLEEFWPDVVLADVYMPQKTGLEVCDYIKRHEKLKHIPVMLLVGSFEPFDEAEARRVGADDTLTKPFQSIRTLVDKVGALLGRQPTAENPAAVPLAGKSESVEQTKDAVDLDGATTLDGASTLEFPDPVETEVPAETLDAGELELTTANTRPLSPEFSAYRQQPSYEYQPIETVEEQKMETHVTSEAGPEGSEGFGDTLLDLSHYEAASSTSVDDVILDIDFDSPAPERFHAAPKDSWQSAVAVEAPPAPPAAPEVEVAWSTSTEEVVEWEGEIHSSEPELLAPTPVLESAAVIQSSVVAHAAEEFAESTTICADPGVAHAPAPIAEASATAAPATGQITLAQLAPEAIDAIARRVVQQLSDKAVQEIAWEVVPQLAELLIKRKLEESK